MQIEGIADCGVWVQSRTARLSQSLEHYLVGLLNGMVMGSGLNFWRSGGPVSREQVYLWMDNFCRNQPLNNLIGGAVRLVNERTNGGWDRFHSSPR